MKKILSSEGRRNIRFATLLIVFSSIIACSKSGTDTTPPGTPGGSGGPGVNEVWISGLAFNPSTITVAAGTTITWTNKDGVAHTVTSNSALFGSSTISPNGTYSHLFSTAGSFPYHCTIHPTMTATAIVN